MVIKATPDDIARFMSYVDKLPNGCWFWTGARSRGKGNRKWYGSFYVQGRTVRAHRFSSEVLGSGECPPGHHRDHTCRFSLCVNPEHLECVSREVNQARKVADHPEWEADKLRCIARLLAIAPAVPMVLQPLGSRGEVSRLLLQSGDWDTVATVSDLATAQDHINSVNRERVAVYHQEPTDHHWSSHHLVFRPFGVVIDNPRATVNDRADALARILLERVLPIRNPNCKWVLWTDTAARGLHQHFRRYGLPEASADLYAERLRHVIEQRLGVVLWPLGEERCRRSSYHLWGISHAN